MEIIFLWFSLRNAQWIYKRIIYLSILRIGSREKIISVLEEYSDKSWLTVALPLSVDKMIISGFDLEVFENHVFMLGDIRRRWCCTENLVTPKRISPFSNFRSDLFNDWTAQPIFSCRNSLADSKIGSFSQQRCPNFLVIRISKYNFFEKVRVKKKDLSAETVEIYFHLFGRISTIIWNEF